MRIISGRLKGKRFFPPKNIPTRPTTDFAKEGLFNHLNNYFNFDNISYLDLFAGTGSLSYEMASRGCLEIHSIEQYPRCANFIKKTANEYDLPINVFQMDVFQYMKTAKCSFDVIFAGPPYPLPNLGEIPSLLFKAELLEGRGWFILEHNQHYNFKDDPHFFKVKNYGNTIFSFFSNLKNDNHE